MEIEKDYSLLRPFDLEAAKRGEKFAFVGDKLEPRQFIAGPDARGAIIIKDEFGVFQTAVTYPYVMLPLAWVRASSEDSTLWPVYKGDVLYYHSNGKTREIVADDYEVMLWMTCADGYHCDTTKMTWQKPKTKREGWVRMTPVSHQTKELAEMFKLSGEVVGYAHWEE